MNFGFAKVVRDGGKGSGNFGHKGRPGQVGGSSKNGGSGEPSSTLLKVATDLTLADVDDHLSKVGIRKGDVVKVFGLRKDVLLSHAQNCMKAQENGDFWRGVFKSEADVEEARRLKADMEANGLTDTKDYIKISRSLARYDFVKGLVDGAQPATAEPPKVEESKVEEPKSPELPIEKEEPKMEEPKAEEQTINVKLNTDLYVESIEPINDANSVANSLINSKKEFKNTIGAFVPKNVLGKKFIKKIDEMDLVDDINIDRTDLFTLNDITGINKLPLVDKGSLTALLGGFADSMMRQQREKGKINHSFGDFAGLYAYLKENGLDKPYSQKEIDNKIAEHVNKVNAIFQNIGNGKQLTEADFNDPSRYGFLFMDFDKLKEVVSDFYETECNRDSDYTGVTTADELTTLIINDFALGGADKILDTTEDKDTINSQDYFSEKGWDHRRLVRDFKILRQTKGDTVSELTSTVTDAGNWGHDISKALNEMSTKNVATLVLEKEKGGGVTHHAIDELTENFKGINFIDDGALPNTPQNQSLVESCFKHISPNDIFNESLEYFDVVEDFEEWAILVEQRARYNYDEARKQISKNWSRKRSTTAEAITSACVLAGLKNYKEMYGVPSRLDGDVLNRVRALGMLEFLASQRHHHYPSFSSHMHNFMLESDGSSLSNAFTEYASNKIPRKNKKFATKQTDITNRMITVSQKPDIKNNLVNTKINKTNRTGNNLDTLSNAFKFIHPNIWKKFTKSGERSAHGLTKEEADSTCKKLKNGLDELKLIDKNKKYNDVLLNSTDLANLLCAMTCGGGYYTTLKEPNRFGSNNLINMLTACGEIVDAKDVPCIRLENMSDKYRNYNLKVGDSIMFDAQHASNNLDFSNNDALYMFGEDAPCRFEVVGKYPRLDLEPFVWKGKGYEEYEQLMAGFFKVKSVENDARMEWEANGRDGTKSVKRVQIEFDWDRYDEYLSLQTRGFADYMGMYGEEEPKKSKGKGK